MHTTVGSSESLITIRRQAGRPDETTPKLEPRASVYELIR